VKLCRGVLRVPFIVADPCQTRKRSSPVRCFVAHRTCTWLSYYKLLYFGSDKFTIPYKCIIYSKCTRFVFSIKNYYITNYLMICKSITLKWFRNSAVAYIGEGFVGSTPPPLKCMMVDTAHVRIYLIYASTKVLFLFYNPHLNQIQCFVQYYSLFSCILNKQCCIG